MSLPDDVSRHVRETEVAPLETVGELPVVQAQQVQDGRVEVVHVHRIFHGVVAQLVATEQNSVKIRVFSSRDAF